MIDKIVIAGFSGAGKSTLATRIEKELGLSVAHIDKQCLLPGKRMKPVNEVQEILTEICEQDKWIIDGLYFKFAVIF